MSQSRDRRAPPGSTYRGLTPGEIPGVGREPQGLELDGLFAPEPEPPSRSSPLDPALPSHVFAPPRRRATGQLVVAAPKEPREASRRPRRPRAHDAELPEPGAIVDKYRIEEVLGVGGFAAVYRATHLILRVEVAIKMLRPRVVRQDRGLASRLCEEARCAARIDHPNVVRIQDITHSPSITYVVMEFIAGETLAETIRRKGHLSPEDVVRVGRDVASGLAAGQVQSLIHRDIKPANILLSKGGRAKIVDFGLARACSAGLQKDATASERGTVVGTPAYMAPEQQSDPDGVDFRADIYALGVTLYHAALGTPPFSSADPLACMAMHRRDPIPAPEAVSPGFPAPLSSLLKWMLQKDPAARPRSYSDLMDAMNGVSRALGRS